MNRELTKFIATYEFLCASAGLSGDAREIRSFAEASEKDGLFVDLRNGSYRFGLFEDGYCEVFAQSHDEMECMYHAMFRVVERHAFAFEMEHRVEGQDARLIAFEVARDKMASIDPAWADRLARYYDAVLARFPVERAEAIALP